MEKVECRIFIDFILDSLEEICTLSFPRPLLPLSSLSSLSSSSTKTVDNVVTENFVPLIISWIRIKTCNRTQRTQFINNLYIYLEEIIGIVCERKSCSLTFHRLHCMISNHKMVNRTYRCQAIWKCLRLVLYFILLYGSCWFERENPWTRLFIRLLLARSFLQNVGFIFFFFLSSIDRMFVCVYAWIQLQALGFIVHACG